MIWKISKRIGDTNLIDRGAVQVFSQGRKLSALVRYYGFYPETGGRNAGGVGRSTAFCHHALAGFTLVELLVVLAIVAALSALIGVGVAQAINKANQRNCLTNMIEIEAAKDEYQRDHPSDSVIPSQTAFAPYFRFGIPRCPNNRNSDYQNLLDLRNPVNCTVHTQNQSLLNPSPTPAS